MIEENKPTTYPKWVGLLLSFILSGSAQFISGNRYIGIAWYITLETLVFLSFLLLAIPLEAAIPAFIILLAIYLTLWIIMMKQSYRHIRRIGFWGWAAIILVSILLGTLSELIEKRAVQVFCMPASSMEPTIMGNKKNASGEKIPYSGDRLFVEKISYHFRQPRRGEVVVFKSKNVIPNTTEYLIKRVVGLPGDRISIQPPYVLINGKKLVDPPIFKNISELMGGYLAMGSLSLPADEIVLDNDKYFLMGDNSKFSLDSRHYGAVPRNNIIGRVTRIVWPLNRMKLPE